MNRAQAYRLLRIEAAPQRGDSLKRAPSFRVMRMLASDKRNNAAARSLAASQADRDLTSDNGELDESNEGEPAEGLLDDQGLPPATAAVR